MKQIRDIGIEYGKAICYSGFREGQQPGGLVPSYEEVKEDLLILGKQWKYIRLFDCDEHTETVLQVIQKEKLLCLPLHLGQPDPLVLFSTIARHCLSHVLHFHHALYTEPAVTLSRDLLFFSLIHSLDR